MSTSFPNFPHFFHIPTICPKPFESRALTSRHQHSPQTHPVRMHQHNIIKSELRLLFYTMHACMCAYFGLCFHWCIRHTDNTHELHEQTERRKRKTTNKNEWEKATFSQKKSWMRTVAARSFHAGFCFFGLFRQILNTKMSDSFFVLVSHCWP